MTARINLTVPEELKARMDAAEGVNWSRIAAQAFEAELGRQEAEGWRSHSEELVAAVGDGGPEGLERVLELVRRTRPELAEDAEGELTPLFTRLSPSDPGGLESLEGTADAGQLEILKKVLGSYHRLMVEPVRNQLLSELVLQRLSKVARRHARRSAFRGRARRRMAARRGGC